TLAAENIVSNLKCGAFAESRSDYDHQICIIEQVQTVPPKTGRSKSPARLRFKLPAERVTACCLPTGQELKFVRRAVDFLKNVKDALYYARLFGACFCEWLSYEKPHSRRTRFASERIRGDLSRLRHRLLRQVVLPWFDLERFEWGAD